MSAQIRWLSLGLALMALIGFGTVASNGVFAQDSTASPSATSDDATTTDDANTDDTDDTAKGNNPGSRRGGDADHGMKGKGGPGMGRMHGVDADALATFLGVTADDIKADLQAGSSLAEIAEANGKTRVELKTFMVQQFEAGLDSIIDASRDDMKANATDGVGETDEATPAVDATPAASTGFAA